MFQLGLSGGCQRSVTPFKIDAFIHHIFELYKYSNLK